MHQFPKQKVKMKNRRLVKVLIFVFFLLISSFSTISAQTSFPRGSSEGTTQMPRNNNNIDFPLIDLSIKQPQTHTEVAFSVQVMILLTVLSLAPSILILVTCFLR